MSMFSVPLLDLSKSVMHARKKEDKKLRRGYKEVKFKLDISRSVLSLMPEAYLGACQTSMMEFL